jgi:hypothetical protein
MSHASDEPVRAQTAVETTAAAALEGGDVDGAYVAAYDAYRMAAESLLARQGLRATGGDGSHMAVEDAVAAQFAVDIPEFAKPTFERFRRTRHSAQYFDPDAAPITEPDASWAIEKATTTQRELLLPRGSSDSRWTPGSSTRSTQYPGRNWVSPITANPASRRLSTVGFSPRSALPILSSRQSALTTVTYSSPSSGGNASGLSAAPGEVESSGIPPLRPMTAGRWPATHPDPLSEAAARRHELTRSRATA